MAPVKKTLKEYKSLRERLVSRLNELKDKNRLGTQRLPISDLQEEESAATNVRGDGLNSAEMATQAALVTDILIEIFEVKLTFLNETISSLQDLVKDNPRQPTPMELQLSRFEDWVDTNQQLYELNTRLYDVQRNMFDIRKSETDQKVRMRSEQQQQQQQEPISLTAQHSVNATEILQNFQTPVNSRMRYISEKLHPRNNRMTFEASKINEYVHECGQFQNGSLENPPVDGQGVVRGAHPQAYHKFIDVLCSHIINRYGSFQGHSQELQPTEVYTAIEHQVVPRIKPFLMKYVMEQERDKLLHTKCSIFGGVTLSQLRVPREYQTNELIPFASSIAYLKGSIFSESPTDKMYSIVKAAKALHDTLGMLEGGGIDGDTFLDLWIYVTIKANLKDMATNIKLMTEYGNPQLGIGEAGYYLTTITAAMNYIEILTAEKLGKQMENESMFLVCENEQAKNLCSIAGSGFQMVRENFELSGYHVAVVRKWALDSSKLFRTILIPTNDENDKVLVSTIKLSNAQASPETVQFFYDKLTEPQIPWVVCTNILNSTAMVATPNRTIRDQIIVLPSTRPLTTEECFDNLLYVLQLIRVGSETKDFLQKEDSFRTKSLRVSTHREKPSFANFSGELNSSQDLLDFSQPRSRFSMPVKRLINRTRKTGGSNKSIQTERLLGRHVNRKKLDHQLVAPITHTAQVKDDSPEQIVVTAEIHEVCPIPSVNNYEGINDEDGLEKDDLSRHEVTLSPIESPDLEIPDYFSPEYVTLLERNFVHNHLNGTPSDDLRTSLLNIVKQCQLILQRLNYLSPVHKLDGVYDDIVANAVQLFQLSHNEKKNSISSSPLSFDGILNVFTYQSMRQEYAKKFNDLKRMSKELMIGSIDEGDIGLFGFPLSTQPEDCEKFTTIVTTFQKKAGIIRSCREGVLCDETVSCVQKMIHRRNTFS